MKKHEKLYRWALLIIVAALYVFLIGPIVVVFIVSFSGDKYLTFPPTAYSFQWYFRYFGDAGWVEATFRSLKIGFTTTILSLILGIPLSFGLVRGAFASGKYIENFVLAPIIVPHIALSIAVYSLFAHLRLIGEWYGLAIAHTVIALPFVTVILLAALRDFDQNIEMAARSLGASKLKAIRYVTLPLLGPAMASAAFLAFITSFDELIIAMFLAGANLTLPKKIFDSILTEIDPTVAAVAVVQISVVYVLLFISAYFRLPGITLRHGK